MKSVLLFTLTVLAAVFLWPSRGYVWLVIALGILAITVFALWRLS